MMAFDDPQGDAAFGNPERLGGGRRLRRGSGCAKREHDTPEFLSFGSASVANMAAWPQKVNYSTVTVIVGRRVAIVTNR
ncbi:MAG: hypothetical protein ACT7A5_12605 [Ferrovibrionaceae bacterium]